MGVLCHWGSGGKKGLECGGMWRVNHWDLLVDWVRGMRRRGQWGAPALAGATGRGSLHSEMEQLWTSRLRGCRGQGSQGFSLD